MLWIGRAVLRERARERRLLLLRRVLLPLVVEPDEHLPGLHTIAEIGQDGAHRAVCFRRYRDLVDGCEGADHVNRPANRIALHGHDRHLFGLAIGRSGLGRVGFRATGGGRGTDEDKKSERTKSAHGDLGLSQSSIRSGVR